MSLEQWLAPVSIDEPCGPNLEYDPDFIRLQELARPQPAQEFRRDGGQDIRVEGSEVDWAAVRASAQSLLARSKDLRVAILLARALLRTEGCAAASPGLELISRLLFGHWDALHPRLDPEDDHDPTMRLNALAALNAADEFVGDLRACHLPGASALGGLCVRDIELAQHRQRAGEGEALLSAAELAQRVDAALAVWPEWPDGFAQAIRSLDAIASRLAERLSAEQVPDFALLRSVLDAVVLVSSRQADAQPSGAVDPAPREGAPAFLPAPAAAPSEIASRADVVATLRRLCAYLEQHEPGNPVQFVLRRAQRMMDMNFLELMADMAPEGLIQAESVLGEKLHHDSSG